MRIVVRAAMSAKNRLAPVPQKFITFITFAIFNPTLNTRHCHSVRLRVPDPCGTVSLTPDHELEVKECAPLSSPEVHTLCDWHEPATRAVLYTGFKLIPGSCSSLARWQAAHCPGTISSKAGGSVAQMSIA